MLATAYMYWGMSRYGHSSTEIHAASLEMMVCQIFIALALVFALTSSAHAASVVREIAVRSTAGEYNSDGGLSQDQPTYRCYYRTSTYEQGMLWCQKLSETLSENGHDLQCLPQTDEYKVTLNYLCYEEALSDTKPKQPCHKLHWDSDQGIWIMSPLNYKPRGMEISNNNPLGTERKMPVENKVADEKFPPEEKYYEFQNSQPSDEKETEAEKLTNSLEEFFATATPTNLKNSDNTIEMGDPEKLETGRKEKENANSLQGSQVPEHLQVNGEMDSADASTGSTTRNVHSGEVVALQAVFEKRSWITCQGQSTCNRSTCPGLYMEYNDWVYCSRERLRMYRMSGPGEMKVGDLVGLFHAEGDEWGWFGCQSDRCMPSSCPGRPDNNAGFSKPEKWLTCGEEVFVLYARGKKLGNVICSRDNIMLFNKKSAKWLVLEENSVALNECSDISRPPTADQYDLCWRAVFEVWKQ